MRTLALLVLVACGGEVPASEAPVAASVVPVSAAVTAPKPSEVDIAAFAGLHAAGAQVVDVRTLEEFGGGHVPGAHHVPLDQLSADKLAGLDRAQPVYFVCASGGRSARATERMRAAGFQAVNVAGGTSAWVAAGHPVER